MESEQFLGAVRKKWAFVVVFVLLGALGAYWFGTTKVAEYEAESVVVVSAQAGVPAPGAQSVPGVTAAEIAQTSLLIENRVATYTGLVTTPTVLQPVIEELRLADTVEELAARVTAENEQKTALIGISVTDSNGEAAAAIANSIALRLAQAVASIESPDGGLTTAPVRVSRVQTATAPTDSTGLSIALITALGGIAGLVLGMIVARFAAESDSKVRDERDVASLTTLPVIGRIPRTPSGPGTVVVRERPQTPGAEAYRALRTYLQASEDGSLVVTSTRNGSSAAATALNLALALGEIGRRVAIVEADLRRPQIASWLGIGGAAGLSSVLNDTVPLESSLQQIAGFAGVEVLPAGQVPSNPSELLESHAMDRLIESLRARFDYVIFCAPPVIAATDAVILARKTEATLVAIPMGRADRKDVELTLSVLDQINTRVAGIVLTDSKEGPFAGSPLRRSLILPAWARSKPSGRHLVDSK